MLRLWNVRLCESFPEILYSAAGVHLPLLVYNIPRRVLVATGNPTHFALLKMVI